MITNDIKLIITNLEQNNIVSIPTDTVYGLSCVIDKIAVKKLIDIKKRDSSKGFIIISSNINHLLKYTNSLELDQSHIEKILAKSNNPTTWIAPAIDSMKWLTGGQNTIAIRLVKSKIINQITTDLNDAIISTSANISGEDALLKICDIDSVFPQIYILKTDAISSKPSNIINLLTNHKMR